MQPKARGFLAFTEEITPTYTSYEHEWEGWMGQWTTDGQRRTEVGRTNERQAVDGWQDKLNSIDTESDALVLRHKQRFS